MSSHRPLARFALGLALLLPTLALADARLEARRHFQIGMSLIAQHDYTRGIDELLRAYAIKPHPNVLYNIARAYSDAGQIPEAIDAYERYLRYNPPDADAVAETLARLKASLPAPRPVEAQRPPDRTPEKPDASDARLSRLEALADRLEKALAEAEALKAAPPSPAPVQTAVAQPLPEPEDLAPDAAPYEEEVEAASRHAQSTLQAPNATTIITAEEIRNSGAHDLVDLLRRVPGAEVMRLGDGSADVSFRGFNQRTANKVLLLVDGRPEYEDFLGVTLWSAVPISLDEIDRIEVIRGPGSALYGANAALGVVNVITREPGTGPKAQLNVTGGWGNTIQSELIASGGDRLRYRASVGYEQADKWSRDFEDGRSDYAPQFSNSDLGLRSARGVLTAQYRVNDSVQVEATGGVNRLYSEIYPPGVLRNYIIDGVSAFAKSDLNAGPFQLRLFWNHLDAHAGPQYAPVGQLSLATDLSSNVLDGQLIWSHDFALVGSHHLQVGTEERLKRVDWSYLGAALHQETHVAAFVQDEWAPAEPFRVVASYRIDRHPLLDDGKPGFAQSPRVAALWMPNATNALRASFATAFREPTFLESYTNLALPLPGVNGASARTVGNTQLKPERVMAFELGYRGEAPTQALEWDLTGYVNQVRDLIEISPLASLPAGGSYDPTSGTYTIGESRFINEKPTYLARGVELGVKYSPIDRLDLTGSAALQKVTASGDAPGALCAPCSEAPAVKVFATLLYRSEANFNFELEGGYTSATTWIERAPDPQNPTQISEASNPLDSYLVLNARIGYRVNDQVTVALEGTDLAAPHQEHPFGNLISRRIFATLRVTP